MAKSKITTKKFGGDDCYSWAVFKDDRPVMTGLSKSSAMYEADRLDPERKTKRIAARVRRWRKQGFSQATINCLLDRRMY